MHNKEYFNKIELDSFYKDTFIKFPEYIQKAGFFNDSYPINSIDYNLNLITTPIHKIINNIKKNKSNKPLMVLLNTGSYSPVHNGHLNMMETAKKYLSKKYNIVGGFLSPSHDEYVSKKYNGTANIHAESRINFIEQSIFESDWLMADPWEARYNKFAINFTDVIRRLEQYLFKHTNKKIIVGYVFGSDNAYFSLAFVNQGVGICIKRNGYEDIFKHCKSIMNIDSNRNFFIDNNNPNISSTEIRSGNLDFMPNIIKNLYINRISISNNKYLFRDDITYCTANIQDNNLINTNKFFINNLTELFINVFKPFINMNIILLNTEQQQYFLNQSYDKLNVINLDLWTSTKNQQSLSISRLFNLSDGQIYSNILINRPGHSSIEKQIKKIKPNNYVLIDDDIASGRTVKMIIKKIPKNIKITQLVALSKISFEQQFQFSIPYEFYDIIDIRDFLVGSLNSGLVVTLPNNKIARVPYMFPYVSLSNRAKIPEQVQMSLSISLWELNLEYYSRLNNVKIYQMDNSFINLALYLGFDLNDSMVDFCNFHITKLTT